MALGYAYHLLGDYHLAQDATQEALIEAWNHVAAIQQPRAWPVWLRRAVFKHCDRLRRRRRLLTVPLEDGLEVADAGAGPQQLEEREERVSHVRAALEVLTEEERAIAVLSAACRYRQREIAQFLEIPLDTVKNRLRSARRKLSERILQMATEEINRPTPSALDLYAEVQELAAACRSGDAARVADLLHRHPEVLDSPDFDERFTYPGSQLWSPLYLAAMNGHEAIVRLVLDLGANPVPYEVAAQYHQWTYEDWLGPVRERGHGAVADRIEAAIAARYGPLVDGADLHRAVRGGDVDAVRALLRQNPERVRQVNAVGNSPLHRAVAADRPEVVRLLAESGADLEARNGDGRTPSVVALFGLHRYWRDEDRPECRRVLLEKGAQLKMVVAAATGDLDRVRQLLAQRPCLANEADPCHRRPLSAAVARGHEPVVRLLLAHGADPNAKEAVCQGGFSLRDAAWKGHLEIVRLLLDHGAVPEHWVDSSGDALYAAHARGHTRILQLLYAHGGTMELLVYAMAHRIDVIAEVLKLRPALANSVLPPGWDEGGSEELACDIMRLAIRYGARFENASAWNLRWTVARYPRLFQLLQEHGADPHVQVLEIAGDQPRRWRDADHHLRTIRFLVEECGGDVNTRSAEGFTPLAHAAREGYAHLVDYFLARGAQVNPEAPDWARPLYLARRHGHAAIAEALQRHGAVA